MRGRTRIAAIVAGSVAVLATAAYADHIRAMTVQQDPSYTGTTVKLRVDFNYSGNCCGGYFNWRAGDPQARTGSVTDGIVNSFYQGDAAGFGTFSAPGSLPPNLATFNWKRFRPNPAVQLVRIEITYQYAAAGSYTVTWDDCCPASQGGVTVVAVSGTAAPSNRILTFTQIGSSTWTDALTQAGYQPCIAGTSPVCFDEVDPATFVFPSAIAAQLYLQNYKVLFVGHDANAATITALNAPFTAQGISNWTQNDRGGLVVYAQSAPTGFSWLPNLGGTSVTTSAPSGGLVDAANVTPRGVAHSSHRNQLPATALAVSTLANWGPSVEHAFTRWPGYFDHVAGAAIAVDAGGTGTTNNPRALSLAGTIGQAAQKGCAFITGQPIEARAMAGVLAAQQMVRSTVGYGISCDDVALGVSP